MRPFKNVWFQFFKILEFNDFTILGAWDFGFLQLYKSWIPEFWKFSIFINRKTKDQIGGFCKVFRALKERVTCKAVLLPQRQR